MNKLYLGLVVILTIMLNGCATGMVDKSKFDKPKTMAIVTVTGSVHGLATSPEEDSQMLSTLVDLSFKELSKSKHIKLVPQKTVLSNKAYKGIKDVGPGFMQDLAPGYKSFDLKGEQAALKAMARELKADGFITIVATYGTAKTGMALSGFLPFPIPISGGSAKATASYFIQAFDKEGEPFWRENVKTESEDGIVTVLGVGDFKALQSKMVDLTQAASREAVFKLDEQLNNR